MDIKKILLSITIVLGLLACLINFETIRTFPSWFDEAVYANMSFNSAHGAGLTLDLVPGYDQIENLIYGPIYFILQVLLIKFFGLQVLVFRLPNFLAAYIVVFLIASVLYRNGLKRNYLLLFISAALVDVSFNRNIVSGRMDMFAVMFISLSLYLVNSQLIGLKNRLANYQNWLMIGCLSAAAYLTTPRALFLLPIVFTSGVHRLFIKSNSFSRNEALIYFLVTIIAFIVPVVIWINYVGGIQAYAAMFHRDTVTSSHIGFSFFRSVYDNIPICIMLCLSIINFKKVIKDPLMIGLIINYITFSVFVKEIGPYAAMIMPFILAIIVLILAKSDYKFSIKGFIFALVLIPGTLLLFLRGIDLYLNSDCRDSKKVISVLDQVLNKDTKIVAPFKYYFFLAQKGRKVVTFEYSKLKEEGVIKDAGLIITNSSDKDLLLSKGYKKANQLVCNPYRVPLLPSTFYSRSVFNEDLLIK